MVELVLKRLADCGQTLALAESCTGGKMAAQVVEVPGASVVFLGGVVSYDNRVKEEVLGVPKYLLQTLGAVSVAVTRAMAKGVRQKMKANWAVAISGIAGPSGGSAERPVGTVCFTVLGPGVEISDTQCCQGGRTQIQAASVEHAFKMLGQQFGVQ